METRMTKEIIQYVCMYVCMYVFIKLHITTQSGPVILVILCHSHWSSRGGINDTYYVCMYGHTSTKSMDQPGKVANHARGQLNREK